VSEAEARKEREKTFHDHAFAEHIRAPLAKYYSIVGKSRQAYAQVITRGCYGKSVLEYGCGLESVAVLLAQRGATVTSIDISPVAVMQATAKARELGLSDRITVLRMDAEELSFDDAAFDLVCGTGVLHHLDLHRAYAEIARVLKPAGRAVFSEPLGHNHLINLYRRATPRHRTVDEHPLRRDDLELARRYFREVRISFYHLSALAAIPFRGTRLFGGVLALLNALDAVLLRLPGLRYQAWMSVFILARPRATTGSRSASPSA
jgi:SAM-dependent methyltransferase